MKEPIAIPVRVVANETDKLAAKRETATHWLRKVRKIEQVKSAYPKPDVEPDDEPDDSPVVSFLRKQAG